MIQRMRALVSLLAACGSAVALFGCWDTYCQSGPKYGTQCYSNFEVNEMQRQQGRAPTGESHEWWNQAAPPSSMPRASRRSVQTTRRAPSSARADGGPDDQDGGVTGMTVR